MRPAQRPEAGGGRGPSEGLCAGRLGHGWALLGVLGAGTGQRSGRVGSDSRSSGHKAAQGDPIRGAHQNQNRLADRREPNTLDRRAALSRRGQPLSPAPPRRAPPRPTPGRTATPQLFPPSSALSPSPESGSESGRGVA